jgi:hypothetical protein
MPDTDIDKLKKQIDDLNKRVNALGGEFYKDVDKAIESFGGGIEGANKALKGLRKEMDSLDTDTNYFYETLKKITKELKGQNNYNKDITKSYSKLTSIASKLKYDQDGISELSEKELRTLEKQVNIQKTDLTSFLKLNEQSAQDSINNQAKLNKQLDYYINQQIKNGTLTDAQQKRADNIVDSLSKEEKIYTKIKQTNEEVNGILTDEEVGLDAINGIISKRLKEEEKIKDTLGISGQIVDGIVGSLGKLGISGSFFENMKEDMRDAAKSGDKWNVVTAGTKGLMKGIGDAMKDPVAKLTMQLKLLKFFVDAALKANTQIVELGKSLGTSSYSYRENIADIARQSSNINATTANLVESYGDLVKATGFAYQFNEDQLTTQTKLTKEVGLTAEEAGKIANLGITTGKTSESTYNSFVKGLVATRNQLKVGIDLKATLAEAANVSGRLAANLGYNPERIAKAVVAAKAFGMTLEQTSKAGESLLNFESSIENELKAELLTGEQLNLERARAAALSGDQATLAEELAKNIGTAADYTKMNVLQQDALAAAVGMTADELGNTLQKREAAIASGKSLAQINEEDAKKALERQSIQDKFNASILKLQDFFGNLVAGPLGAFLDILSNVFKVINFILTPIKLLISLAGLIGETFGGWAEALGPFSFILKGIAGIAILIAAYGAYAALAWIPIVGPILGAAAAVAVMAKGFGALSSQKAGDMISPADGKTQVSTKEGGLFELSKNDDLMAGPGLASKSKSSESMQGPSIDLTPMIMAINAVKASVDRLYGKDSSVHMDGKKVGTTLAQGSHKVA